jgi:hypothetical protein
MPVVKMPAKCLFEAYIRILLYVPCTTRNVFFLASLHIFHIATTMTSRPLSSHPPVDIGEARASFRRKSIEAAHGVSAIDWQWASSSNEAAASSRSISGSLRHRRSLRSKSHSQSIGSGSVFDSTSLHHEKEKGSLQEPSLRMVKETRDQEEKPQENHSSFIVIRIH